MITRRKLLLAARELPKVKVRYATGVQQLNEEFVVALPNHCRTYPFPWLP
jgi:hypothetical protein